MFNTLWYTKNLEEVGVSRKQAEVHVEIMANIIETNLATKQDMKDLKTEMQHIEYRMIIKNGVVTASILTFILALFKFFGN